MRKAIYCLVVFLVTLLPVPSYFSVSSAKEEMECAYMILIPSALSLSPGRSEDVAITVLDKEKKPIPGYPITLTSEDPELVAVEPKKVVTDKDGKATVKVKGLARLDYWPLNIDFDCADHLVSTHVR